MAICTLTIIAWIFAPQLAALAAPGFSADQIARLSTFTRIILPAQAFFLPGACFTALLYHRRQFIAPALAPLLYNGGIITGGLIFYIVAPEAGMEGFCWGVLAGAGAGSLALPYLAAKSGGLKLLPALRHPMLKRFAALALPLMIGQSIVALDEQMLRIFGSMSGIGAVSLLSYAQKLMQVPVAVLAQAAGAASYPFLARLAATGQEKEFSETLGRAIKNTLLLLFPASALMFINAEPLVRLIFGQGRFDAIEECALLLQIMLLAVPLWGVQQLIGRAFYSRQDTVTPAVIGTIATVLSLAVYWQGALLYGARGVALATSAALLFYTTGLIWRWIQKYGATAFAPVAWQAGKGLISSILASIPACVVSYYLRLSDLQVLFGNSPTLMAILLLTVSSLVFMAALFCASKLLRLPLLPGWQNKQAPNNQ